MTRPPRPPPSPDARSLTGELVGRTRLRQLFGAPFAVVGAGPLMAALSPYSPQDGGRLVDLSRAIGYRPEAARAIVDRDNRVVRSPNGRQEPVSELLAGGVLPRSGCAGHFLGMVVTLPLSRSARLTVAWTRTGGFRAAAWRAEPRCGLFPEGDDGRGSVGVREPRRPRPPRLGGAVALPLDNEPADATF